MIDANAKTCGNMKNHSQPPFSKGRGLKMLLCNKAISGEENLNYHPKKGVTRVTKSSISEPSGGVDGTRTRGLRRDRPAL